MAHGETDDPERAGKVFVYAPFGRDAEAVADVARNAGIPAAALPSSDELLDAIRDGFGALVLTEEAFGGGLGADLAHHLRDQPVWSEAPILCLVDNAARPPAGLDRLRGSEARLDLVLLERPIRPATLLSSIQSLLKGRRAQYLIRDQILELEARNDRLRFLLGELDHRVKNMLAKVSSIAMLTSGQAADVPSFVATFKDRIAAMARAQDMMAGNRQSPVLLEDAIRDVLDPFVDADGTNMRISGPDIELRLLGGLTLAMVLHELATNAAKYGALSVPEGRVAITWSVSAGEDRTLHLEWRESGGPPVQRPSRRSFGSKLIDTLAPHELDAEVALDFAPDGVRCDMAIPLKHGIAASEA